MRAAGKFIMSTVKLPSAMTSGGPTHKHMSVGRELPEERQPIPLQRKAAVLVHRRAGWVGRRASPLGKRACQ
jgi:hypothetical protein